MSTATAPARERALSTPRGRAPSTAHVRERWRMGAEARGLILVMSLLLAFGLAVLYSASAIDAMQRNKASWFYLARQLSGVGAGMVGFAIAAKLDAERFRRWAWPIMWITIVSLLLCLVLPESVAPRVNGSRRFLFGSSFQPSEFGKLAVVVWTSMLIVKKGDQLRRLTKGVLPFFVIVGALDVLVALEPDLSVAMLYTLMLAVLLFAGGVRIAHFVTLCALAIPALWTKIEKVQYALLRLTAFLDPGGAPAQVNYQLKQSLIAVGSGGLFGVGFGEGRQQYGFLPFPYSDFIASNIGEEWGFLGLAAVTIAFAAYALLGFRIARQARSPFLQLVALGLTFVTVITAYLHIGVVIGLLPTTGLTLPFVSYGRSNIVLTMFMTGVLVNIGSTKERVIGSGATDPLAVPPAPAPT
ncbi:MAG TPA: putative peptidoglycan glycosyltransferase FtsW [Gemmatimonadaceae bacterium]|nr:putative peptidoglycan glycosyltransferase FtsW [Gemmatimonadaceae bacterium]